MSYSQGASSTYRYISIYYIILCTPLVHVIIILNTSYVIIYMYMHVTISSSIHVPPLSFRNNVKSTSCVIISTLCIIRHHVINHHQ